MHRLLMVAVCTVAALAPASAFAQQPRRVAPGATAAGASASAPRILPGTRESAFTVIQGNALNSSNGALPDSHVRLRDARYGRIVGAQVTDKAGVFVFRSVDPGTYVVELMDDSDRTVLAASELLSVSAGDSASAIVKLPFRVEPFGGLLGHTMQQALAVISAAAASGVLVSNVTGVDASAR